MMSTKMIRTAAKTTLSVALAVMMLPMQVFAETTYDSGVNDYGSETTDNILVQAEENDVTVTGGDITVSEPTPAYDALRINVDNDNTATVSTGDITFDGDGGGVTVNNYSNTDEDTSRTLNLTVNGNINSGSNGVYNITGDGGTTNIAITGDVNSGYDGINTANRSGGETNITVGGDVAGDHYGVDMVSGNEGTTNLTIGGDLSGTRDGIDILTYDGGIANIQVGGDITGDLYGVYAYSDVETAGKGYGSINIRSEGTISGGEVAVNLLSGDQDANANILITAWKIEKNADGIVAGYDDYDTEELIEDKYFEKHNISYIIKVEQPSEGATFTASHETAHEGEMVTMEIDVSDGYVITGAYGDMGKSIPLTKNAYGSYSMTVPKGGGVYLSLVVEAVEDQEKSETSEPDNDTADTASNDTPAIASIANYGIVDVARTTTKAEIVKSMCFKIATTPSGERIQLELPSLSIDAAVVSALIDIKDTPIELIYYYMGIKMKMVIPAGFDLEQFVRANGTIDITALIDVIGHSKLNNEGDKR